MISPEAVVNCSNDKEELKNALIRINRDLDRLKHSESYNKNYNDFIEFTYLQKLKQKALIKEKKLYNPHF